MTFERKLKEAYREAYEEAYREAREEARIEERKNAVIRLYNFCLQDFGSHEKALHAAMSAYPEEDVVQIVNYSANELPSLQDESMIRTATYSDRARAPYTKIRCSRTNG